MSESMDPTFRELWQGYCDMKEERNDLHEAVRMFLACLDQYGVSGSAGTSISTTLTSFYIGPEDCGGGWLRQMRKIVDERTVEEK